MSENNNTAETFDLVGAIIDFEQGELDNEGALTLFSHLIKSGAAWSLQGGYGRTAAFLIEDGWLTPEGDRTDKEF